jgi:hypothetical protein
MAAHMEREVIAARTGPTISRRFAVSALPNFKVEESKKGAS